jgi:hypothetical protein
MIFFWKYVINYVKMIQSGVKAFKQGGIYAKYYID